MRRMESFSFIRVTSVVHLLIFLGQLMAPQGKYRTNFTLFVHHFSPVHSEIFVIYWFLYKLSYLFRGVVSAQDSLKFIPTTRKTVCLNKSQIRGTLLFVTICHYSCGAFKLDHEERCAVSWPYFIING